MNYGTMSCFAGIIVRNLQRSPKRHPCLIVSASPLWLQSKILSFSFRELLAQVVVSSIWPWVHEIHLVSACLRPFCPPARNFYEKHIKKNKHLWIEEISLQIPKKTAPIFILTPKRKALQTRLSVSSLLHFLTNIHISTVRDSKGFLVQQRRPQLTLSKSFFKASMSKKLKPCFRAKRRSSLSWRLIKTWQLTPAVVFLFFESEEWDKFAKWWMRTLLERS